MSAVTLRGVNLGYMGIDLTLVADRPDFVGLPYQCPVIAYIIDHPQGRILWETGLSARPQEDWPDEWQQIVDLREVTPEKFIERRLKEMKLGPDDFRYVVQGHLHTDHSGGLHVFKDAGAEIVVHEHEYRHVMDMEVDHDHFFNRRDWAFLGEQRPTLVSGDSTELMEGVRLVSLPGHTPGQMGLLLQLDHTGSVLLTSDALYHHANYDEPAAEPQIFWDLDQWRTSVGKIKTIAQHHDALIFPGHDETGIQQLARNHEFKKIEFWPNYIYE